MVTEEVQDSAGHELPIEAIRDQLELLVQDPGFRSSKRSVQFLRYVVERTLQGFADQIKERTIGSEVFGRDPSYDTNLDHVVRTAATELRKRLAVYYGEERHRSELRVSLIPGSYIPRFTLPVSSQTGDLLEAAHHATHAIDPLAAFAPDVPASTSPFFRRHRVIFPAAAVLLFGIIVSSGWYVLRPRTSQDLFWKPIVETPGFVLLAVGNVPDGPPVPSQNRPDLGPNLPILHKPASSSVPFADTVTIARVMGTLQSRGKRVVIRQESSSTFSELRESPVVLIGAFNNEWSLRLTQNLRYSLALDADRHVIFIKDAKNPEGRTWNWPTNQPTDHQGAAGGPPLQDFALISRIWNSETGHAVIIIGGLYTYGTEAAGEFLTEPQMMEVLGKEVALRDPHRNLQIILGTLVTDGTAGPPRVLAVWSD